jgi:hypothetical protein
VKHSLVAFGTIAALAMSACGGTTTTTTMGYRWPDAAKWQARVVPPRVVLIGAAHGGYSAPLTRAVQYQVEACENIALAYGELASHRVQSGTYLAGVGGSLGAAAAILVGASQTADDGTSARTTLLWTGVSAGVVGAGLALAAAFSGDTQASAYNDAVTHVRGHIDDFLSNIRSHDNVAGEYLNEGVLAERVCALREDCRTPEFDVREVGHPFGTASQVDVDTERYLDDLCKPDRIPAAPPDPPKPPSGS